MKKETARQASIRCPTGLFPRQEEEIARLTQAINRAPTAAEKAPWAQALLEAVDVLLACEQYDEESLDCRLCRNFSWLRRKTATLVIKAGRLDDRRRRTTVGGRKRGVHHAGTTHAARHPDHQPGRHPGAGAR